MLVVDYESKAVKLVDDAKAVEAEETTIPISAEERIEALEAALLELMGVVLNG